MCTICKCGKLHQSSVDDVFAQSGAINEIPEFIIKYKATKAFVLVDTNTYNACGKKVFQHRTLPTK